MLFLPFNEKLKFSNPYISDKTGTVANSILGLLIGSKSPILKASVDSDAITDNVQISISTDLSSWIPMETTSSLNLSGNSKIVSFNTINELSFKTGEDVKTMYVRFTLVNKGTDLEKSKSFKTVKENSCKADPSQAHNPV